MKSLKRFPFLERRCKKCGSRLHVTNNFIIKCPNGHVEKCYLRNLEIKAENCKVCPYSPEYYNPELERLSKMISKLIKRLSVVEKSLRRFRTRKTRCKAKVIESKIAQLLAYEKELLDRINKLALKHTEITNTIKSGLEYPKLYKKCFQSRIPKRFELYIWNQ